MSDLVDSTVSFQVIKIFNTEITDSEGIKFHLLLTIEFALVVFCFIIDYLNVPVMYGSYCFGVLKPSY